jgi:hypothetical protein
MSILRSRVPPPRSLARPSKRSSGLGGPPIGFLPEVRGRMPRSWNTTQNSLGPHRGFLWRGVVTTERAGDDVVSHDIEHDAPSMPALAGGIPAMGVPPAGVYGARREAGPPRAGRGVMVCCRWCGQDAVGRACEGFTGRGSVRAAGLPPLPDGLCGVMPAAPPAGGRPGGLDVFLSSITMCLPLWCVR